MAWWSWMVLGAVLLAAELFAVDAQFYLVFLGVSAALGWSGCTVRNYASRVGPMVRIRGAVAHVLFYFSANPVPENSRRG